VNAISGLDPNSCIRRTCKRCSAPGVFVFVFYFAGEALRTAVCPEHAGDVLREAASCFDVKETEES